MYSGYKDGRTMSTRFNRREDVVEKTVEEEYEDMKLQFGKLYEYLETLPMTVMSIDNIEADDAIAYMTTEIFQQKNSKVIIMSDDKDFIQLVNENVSVWRPVEKKYYEPAQVLDKFKIPSNNFIHFKVFNGDASDNIKGIKGIGIKTMQTKLPILFESDTVDLPTLLDYCETHRGDHKIYETILQNKNQLELNWQLMSLTNLNISSNFKLMICDMVERECPKLNVFQFKKLFMRDKVYNVIPNVDHWLSSSFNVLSVYS
jgi:5'-3' exonuclease